MEYTTFDHHKKVSMMNGDEIIEIDEQISKLISEIWKRNIKTNMSCQGNGHYAWVIFDGVENASKFLNLVNKRIKIERKWQIRSFYIENNIRNGVHVTYKENCFKFLKNETIDTSILNIVVSFPNNHIDSIVEILVNEL
jgi:hypothetical protein